MFSFLIPISLALSILTQTNQVSVDDTDPRVIYSDTQGAVLLFMFYGTEVELWAGHAPVTGPCDVLLDGIINFTIHSNANATGPSALWTRDGLDPSMLHNVTYTVRLAPPALNECMIDRFAYTPPTTGDRLPLPPTSVPFPTGTASSIPSPGSSGGTGSTNTGHKQPVAAIAAGAAVGGIVLTLLILFGCWVISRRRRINRDSVAPFLGSTADDKFHSGSTPVNGPASFRDSQNPAYPSGSPPPLPILYNPNNPATFLPEPQEYGYAQSAFGHQAARYSG